MTEKPNFSGRLPAYSSVFPLLQSGCRSHCSWILDIIITWPRASLPHWSAAERINSLTADLSSWHRMGTVSFSGSMLYKESPAFNFFFMDTSLEHSYTGTNEVLLSLICSVFHLCHHKKRISLLIALYLCINHSS